MKSLSAHPVLAQVTQPPPLIDQVYSSPHQNDPETSIRAPILVIDDVCYAALTGYFYDVSMPEPCYSSDLSAHKATGVENVHKEFHVALLSVSSIASLGVVLWGCRRIPIYSDLSQLFLQ